MSPLFRWLFLGLLCFGFLVEQVQSFAAVVNVRPETDECYLVRTPSSWSEDLKRNPRYVYGGFELLSAGRGEEPAEVGMGGSFIVYFATFDLKNMMYRSRRGQSSGDFDVSLEAGKKYWFCLVNKDDGGNDMTDEERSREGRYPDNRHRHAAQAMAGMTQKVGFALDLVTADEFDYTDLGGNPVDMEDESAKAHREAKERSNEWSQLSARLSHKLKDMRHHFDYLRVQESVNRALTEKTFTDVLTWTVAEAAVVAMVALGQIFYFRRYLERNKSYTMLG